MEKLKTKDKILNAESRESSPSEKAWSPTASYFPKMQFGLTKPILSLQKLCFCYGMLHAMT